MDIKESEILGADAMSHWYYRSKAAALSRMLSGLSVRKILDVGAGSGVFSRHLLMSGRGAEAWCVDPNYSEEKDVDVAGQPMHFRRVVQSASADLVLLMDVLEHVDDDVALLREYVAQLAPRGHVLISVPAFQFLWSGHDEFLEHRRRYTLKQTEAVIRAAGLEVVRGCYYFGAVFPIAAIQRLAARLRHASVAPESQLKRHSAPVNALLKIASLSELPLLRWNRFGGLTVFCLARKP